MTTGIVYMPVGLAVLAAQAREAGHEVCCIDAVGRAPASVALVGKFLRRGLSSEDCVARIPDDSDAIAVYALNLLNHEATCAVVRSVRKRFPDKPCAVIENNQAVTSYALHEVADSLYAAGADSILTGESDRTLSLWLERTTFSQHGSFTGALNPLVDSFPNALPEMEKIPLPAWDLFPLKNYWKLGHAHGPFSTQSYLPIQTSRGCPYHCRFCVTPALTHGRWRPRPAEAVVEEMLWAQKKFGVREFHWEDMNPTIDDKRTRAICEGLLRSRASLVWKIVSGTKVESLRDEETIQLMARSGCKYLSISPETGSPDVLRLMGKPFDLDHAVRIAHASAKAGIFLQCCFVLGFPGETKEDLLLTKELIERLTALGVDEIALFIMTPAPGSKEYKEPFSTVSLSELNFSPTWREDYHELSFFRGELYKHFVIQKTLGYPLKVTRQAWNFIFRRFETKMEMAPWRALCHRALIFRARPGNL